MHHSNAIAYRRPANKDSSAVDPDPPDRRSRDRTSMMIAATHSFMGLGVSRSLMEVRVLCTTTSMPHLMKPKRSRVQPVPRSVFWVAISAAIASQMRFIKTTLQFSPILCPVCYTLIVNFKTFTIASTCRFVQISAWTPLASLETPTSMPTTSRPMSSSSVLASAACTSCTNSATN
jgi:hypothetical protein